MNEHFYNPETIEAYLENALSGTEKASFEAALTKDPLLNNEVTLQNDIIEALKQQRKAELKNRLNNIEVSSTPNYLGVKIAASIVLSGLLTFGIYSIFNDNTNSAEFNKNSKLSPIANANQNQYEKTNTVTDKEEVISSPENNQISVENNSNKELQHYETKSMKFHKKSTATPVETAPQLNMAPEISFSENENFQQEESLSLPDNKIAQSTETKGGIDITVDPSTNNKFHYKYYNNKLFLFGNFDANTYEILELNTYKGRQVYLYYQKDYYLLNSNQLQVSPLKKITDKKAIEDLNKFNK